VAIETAKGIDLKALSALVEVRTMSALPPRLGSEDSTQWEIEMRDNADVSAVLRACFERGIPLRGFQYTDPTLHDVFVQLVGPEAREASFR
jgi:ABC-2 type transport system ATP-binding protein